MGLRLSFLSGLGWSGGLKILAKLLTAVKLAIIARLLSPADFGLFSLVLVSLSLIEVFTETGINTIIIQSEKKITHFLDTAWIVSIGRGVLIAGLMVMVGFGMQYFYDEPQLFSLVLIASLTPIVRGFINPAINSLQKDLHFGKDTLYRSSLVVCDLFLSIILVFIFRDVRGLILAIVFTGIFDAVLTQLIAEYKPRFKFQFTVFKEIMSKTKWLNGFAILDYLNKNLDDLIVGRMLGTTNLGYYRNAYALTQSGTAELGLPVITASFPIYSRLQKYSARFVTAVQKVFFSFSTLLLLPTLVFVFFPEMAVRIFLGEQWLSIIPYVPVLAIAGYIQGLFNISSPVFLATQRYSYLTLLLAMTLTTMVGALLVLTPTWGLLGVAWAIAISRLIVMPIYALFVFSALKYPNKSPR